MTTTRSQASNLPQGAAIRAILQSFNTWAFKREQPSSLERLQECVAIAAMRAEPLRFVLYWGKGPRSAVAQPDIQCLDYLATMTRRIGSAYPPGAHLTLVCTDTHALHNGHSPHSIQTYYADIAVAASERGFSSCRLGSLSPVSALAEMMPMVDEIQSETLRGLVHSAERWYRGGHTAEQGALRYYRMNMVEKRAIELAFPDAIFITFNGSDYRVLFPDTLPIFYMYSVKRGVAVKPWFMNDAGASFDCAPPLAQAPQSKRLLDLNRQVALSWTGV